MVLTLSPSSENTVKLTSLKTRLQNNQIWDLYFQRCEITLFMFTVTIIIVVVIIVFFLFCFLHVITVYERMVMLLMFRKKLYNTNKNMK